MRLITVNYMLDKISLEAQLSGLGLMQGDMVLIHSSFKSIGPVVNGAKTLIDAILSVIGNEGTLIAPTFNFDFCNGNTFDINNTKSDMGIVTELVRNHPLSIRTMHPIFSFGVIGKYAKKMMGLNNKSSFGKDSLFQLLRELGGKILIIGLNYDKCMTYFHHVEEIQGIKYRYNKKFSGDIIDRDGNVLRNQDYYMLVRDLEKGVKTRVDPMGEKMEEDGIVREGYIGDALSKIMYAQDVFDTTLKWMKIDPKLLYIDNEDINEI
jgi:aminoglycoside 3-N-acetyltransferase